MGSPKTYAAILSSLRKFFRDYLGKADVVETFKFPYIPFNPKLVPSKEDLKRFYLALKDDRARALFLFYATTGLRRSEVLTLRMEDLDWDKGMVVPGSQSRNKHTWVAFFNDEAEEALKKYLDTRGPRERKASQIKVFSIHKQVFSAIWRETYKETEIKILPQTLREWFACEMARLGVPDRYVDALCGRTPRSVLARHYTDYSPEKLKEIYDRAGLKVLAE